MGGKFRWGKEGEKVALSWSLPPEATQQISSESSSTKKTLTFSNKVQVHLVLSNFDMSISERRATWYSQMECKNLQRACIKEIKLMQRSQRLLDRNLCARGLEGFTQIGLIQKRKIRSLSIYRVLAEQERQNLVEGSLNEHTVARIYHQITASSQLWANRIGLFDQREAEEIMLHEMACEWSTPLGCVSKGSARTLQRSCHSSVECYCKNSTSDMARAA